ncbi:MULTISPECIES: flagellar export protein FliJ [Sinobaca]|uniref:Flagellar FliJ protein n=1 Tax=Sinobaca qinghaiensis TaxID=342944 RepID=A0A419V5X2_9BACL|nr:MULTISPECIES: flagellar export protein FliJ [Sinobaca]RKD75370.1 flagellar FliJ protein [Sinobaca qinghaiensis]
MSKTRDVFEKMLKWHEQEKQVKTKEYQQALTFFEETATKLYELLRKKEEQEGKDTEALRAGVPVLHLQHHGKVMKFIHQDIHTLTVETNKARSKMDTAKEELTVSFQEFKKYEKLLEKKKEEETKLTKQTDAKLMDELSARAFVFNGN